METKQIAMLMDFENLVIGIENNDPEQKKIFSAKGIIDYLQKEYGRVVFRKAFADWSNTKFRKYTSDMVRAGIEMYHIVRGNYNKSYAESHMVIQAMDCLIRNPSIDTFVLCTGDADFLPLISHLKSTGRTVIGLGTEGAVSGALLSNCDDFILYGPDGLHKNETPQIDKGMVIRAIKAIIGTSGIYLSDLENDLMDEVPDFSPDYFGCDDFEAFLETLAPSVRIDNVSGDEPMVYWNSHSSTKTRFSKSDNNAIDTQNMSLGDYMKATRWFIADGPTRENVLENIYNILSENNRQMTSDALRQDACAGLDVEDKAWQGTIYSLVCGNCLWEKNENDYSSHNNRLQLHKNIQSIEDFMLGYYTSLFHKAFMERQDINPQSMTELMHPEDEDGHIQLFETVYNGMSERH